MNLLRFILQFSTRELVNDDIISVLIFLFKHVLWNIHMYSTIEDGWKTFNEIISHQLYNKKDKGTNNDLQNTGKN